MTAEALTQFGTAALVLDNVAVIERPQDLDLLHPALRDMTVLLFQHLPRHVLSCPVVGRVVQVESHHSKVTLRTEQRAVDYSLSGVTGKKQKKMKNCRLGDAAFGLTFPKSRIFFR